MSKKPVIQELEKQQVRNDIPDFKVGDTVRVYTRIIEGEKERVQVFTGTVIARKGKGISETFSVHRVAYGEGMERVFILHSPRIAKIEVAREGEVCRSKLYYLRGTSGKKSKVKSRGYAKSTKAKASQQTIDNTDNDNALNEIDSGVSAPEDTANTNV